MAIEQHGVNQPLIACYAYNNNDRLPETGGPVGHRQRTRCCWMWLLSVRNDVKIFALFSSSERSFTP